jgi:hypothetical protein
MSASQREQNPICPTRTHPKGAPRLPPILLPSGDDSGHQSSTSPEAVQGSSSTLLGHRGESRITPSPIVEIRDRTTVIERDSWYLGDDVMM